MLTTRLTSIAVMFILLHLSNSTAQYSHQVLLEKIMGADGIQPSASALMNVKKENFEGVTGEAKVINTRPAGSKMIFKRALAEEILVKENVGNCGHRGKGNLKAACKLSNLSPHAVKAKTDGVRVFSADYRGPKSHPPKNN